MALVHLNGDEVAFSGWRMPDETVRMVRMTQQEKLKADASSYDPYQPDPQATFLMAVGGIPAVDTPSGWPSQGDYWEADNEEDGRHWVVAVGDEFNWSIKIVTAEDPLKTGVSRTLTYVYESKDQWQKVALSEIDPVSKATVAPTQLAAEVVGSIPNHKSVTFDAAASGFTGNGTSVTISHTVANQPNRHMSAGASFVNGAGQVLSTVVFNGSEGLTQSTTDVSGNRKSELWYRLAPTATTANVVFTITVAAANGFVCGTLSAYGAHQSIPYSNGAGTTSNGISTAPSLTVVSAASELVFINVCYRTGVLTADGTWNTAWNVTSTPNTVIGYGAYLAGAASVTLTASGTISTNWSCVGGAIKAAPQVFTYAPTGGLSMAGDALKCRTLVALVSGGIALLGAAATLFISVLSVSDVYLRKRRRRS